MTDAPQKKLRVLCLHGHRTNDKVMMNQTKGLRAALGDDVEYIFLNAPNKARGKTDPIIEQHHGQDAPFYEWWAVRPVGADDNYPLDDPVWSMYHEYFDESFDYITRQLQEIGPIDVVLGFSQGAIFLTIISMRYLQLYNKRPWKLCVCVGGVYVRAVNHQEFFLTPSRRDILVPFPSIHIIGKEDPFYNEGVALTEAYDSFPTTYPQSPLKKLVFYHSGGHKFPPAKKYAKLYEDVARIIKDHCRLCDAPPEPTPSKL